MIALLCAGIGLSWGPRLGSGTKLRPETIVGGDNQAGQSGSAPEHIYFVDIEGWYRATPHETAVRSPFDLIGETTAELAGALPADLGQWHQVGSDEYIADDPAIVYYLKDPTVALQRTYQDASGHVATLVLIGNKGDSSYLLFSHTPETCYPGRLWQVVEQRQESTLLDGRPMSAQYLLTQHAETGDKLMVLYWYLWDSPERDPERGVLSMRINLFIPSDGTEEVALERAWDLTRALFPATEPWERF